MGWKERVSPSSHVSILVKVGAMFLLLCATIGTFLLTTSNLTKQLSGVSKSIEQAGTERMRIYKLASILQQLAPTSEKGRESIHKEIEQFERVVEGLRSGTPQYGSIAAVNPALSAELQELYERWSTRLKPALERALESGSPASATTEYVNQVDDFVVGWDHLVQSMEQESARRLQSLHRRQTWFLLAFFGLMTAAMIFLDWAVRRPLKRLTAGAERLAAGELHADIQVHAHDELGQLARTFQRMAETIRHKIGELNALHATGQARVREVERKVAELTHEVKAPAGRVAEFASWIERDYGRQLDSKGLQYLAWIKKEGSDLASLAERTLDLARINHQPSPQPSPLERVNVDSVLRELLALLEKDCIAKGVQVTIAPDLPHLACRRIHVKQIFENLIGNAIKYMGSQPHPLVEIGSVESREGTLVFVRDNGIGIEPSMIDRIFLPFIRLGIGNVDGSGIGLSIVKTVVEQYEGSVSVDSTPGAGSTFYVRLPVISPTPSPEMGIRSVATPSTNT